MLIQERTKAGLAAARALTVDQVRKARAHVVRSFDFKDGSCQAFWCNESYFEQGLGGTVID